MLTGKKAVITGASGGIGLATLKKFSENHADSFVLVRNIQDCFLKELQAFRETYNVKIEVIQCDLANPDDIKNASKQISKSASCIDILINNAGTAADSTLFHMTSINKIQEVFAINFLGTTILTQYISRMMIKNKKGAIVNISSIAAIDGTPAQYEYVSSKAALIGATKELAIELGQYNIRVNAVAPGITSTKMAENIKTKLKNVTLQNSIMKRPASPEEIANAILFMASDMSSYITGQILRVDGGTI